VVGDVEQHGGGRDLLVAALELEPAQREQDDIHGEPAQQLEQVGPDARPAEVNDVAEGVRRRRADPETIQDVPEGREHGALETGPGAGEVEQDEYSQPSEERPDHVEDQLQAPGDHRDDKHVQCR
jgi:hypothetical protein